MTEASVHPTASRTTAPRLREWLAPAGLILLSLVPVVAGSMRLTELASDPVVTADNARFLVFPAPVVVHIVGATVFALLGALQFAPSLRRHRWHRISGRIAAPAGLLAALSGLWLTVFSDLPASDGQALAVTRLVFGTAMAASIVVAFAAVRRGDIRTHSAWMTRGYAIGLGAGTQVFTMLAWFLPFGEPDVNVRAGLMAAGWVINLAVAEVVIRRRDARGMFRPSGRSTRAAAALR